MNKINKCIRRQLSRKRILSGGVLRNHPYVHKGHTIYYNSEPNIHLDPKTILIYGGREKGKYPCFILIIKNGLAILQGVKRGDDCFTDGFDNTKDIVIAAFSLAKSMGCTAFQLTDNSTKTCNSHTFTLSDMYFVTTGQTWYESILQVKIQDYSDSQMESFRKIVKTAKWADTHGYF